MAFEKRIHQVAQVFDDEDLEEDEEEEDDDDEDDEEEEEEEDYADDTIVLTPKNLHRPSPPPPPSAPPPPPPLNFLSKPTVFDVEEDDDDDEEDDDPHSPSSSSNLLHTPPPSSTLTVAVAGNPQPLTSVPDLKRQDPSLLVPPHPTEKKHSALDDSRRLFQRLWTDEDEMELLQGFLDYTAHRTTTSHHHHHDTAAFYDQIRSKLQLDFNKNQLVEKLRRLKKKYRNVTARITSGKDFAFKTPHEHATFELSRKIWSNADRSVSAIVAVDNTLDEDDAHVPLLTPIHNNNNSSGTCQIADGNMGERKGMRSRKRPRPPEKHSILNHLHSNNVHMGPSFTNIVEETVRSCLSPMFKELLQTTISGGCSIGGCSLGGSGVSPFGGAGIGGVSKQAGDERWRKQQILELEVYSKRLELVQEHIQITLQQLRSGGS